MVTSLQKPLWTKVVAMLLLTKKNTVKGGI